MPHTSPRSRALFLSLALLWPASAVGQAGDEPLFTFVQVSDSQPASAQHQSRFEEVIAAIVAAGEPGALLPRPVDFVLFAGDLVDVGTEAQWTSFIATLQPLAMAGIPYRAVPGNHDRSGAGISLYEQFVASANVWDVSSSSFTGHNGIAWSSGVLGLRVIGLNNADSGEVAVGDVAQVAARVAQAEASGENVLVMAHFPHDASGVPLRNALASTSVLGYLHGHTGRAFALRGLAGIGNPNLWELNTNSIKGHGALIYFEAQRSELHAWDENTLTFSNAPPPGSTAIDATGAVSSGSWVEFEVTSALFGASGPQAMAFALTSSDGNSVYYSSSEGSKPELRLVLAAPALTLDRIQPLQIEVLTPGTEQGVTITGAGFSSALTVEVGAAALDASAFTVVDQNTLTLDLPALAPGTHGIVLRRGDMSVSTAIAVVLPTQPLLEAGTGEPFSILTEGQLAPLRVAGAPGAGFSDIVNFRSGTIPPGGLVTFHIPVVVPRPMTAYLQGITFGNGLGVRPTNLQSVALSF